MSISAPEAHHVHLPENIIRGAEDYVDVPADLGSSGAELPVGDQTGDVALRAMQVEQGNSSPDSPSRDIISEPDL
jgi:hypothetical protein